MHFLKSTFWRKLEWMERERKKESEKNSDLKVALLVNIKLASKD